MKSKLLSTLSMVVGLMGAAWGQLDTAANVSGVSFGAIYNPGTVRALSWRVLVPHPGSIELSFSVNGSVWTPVVSLPANSTSYNWTVPATLTFHGLIRVYQLRSDTNPVPPPANITTPYSLRSAQFTIAYPLSITGTVTNSTGGPIAGANVVLIMPGTGGQRVDSAVTNGAGTYAMAVNVLATTGYTMIVSAPGYNSLTRNNVTLAAGLGGNTQSFVLTASVGILNATSENSQPRMHWLGNRLAVELGYSYHIRAVEIFGLNGVLKNRFPVRAGESRLLLPAEMAPLRGTMLRVKQEI